MTTDERAEHTPEPFDVYEFGGSYIIVSDGLLTETGYYPIVDWDFDANGIEPKELAKWRYCGNALRCVNACAGLGDDPAARIAELLEAEKQRNDYRILAAHPATRGDVVPAAPLRALVDKMWSDADLANMTADSEMATRDWGVAIDRILREHGVDKEPDAAAPEFDPTAKPIWETVVAIGAKIPESEWDSVPKPQDAECAHCGGDLVMLCPKCTRFNVTVQNTEPPDAADPAAKEKPDEC